MKRRTRGLLSLGLLATTAAFAGLPLPFVIVRVLVPLTGYPVARYASAVARASRYICNNAEAMWSLRGGHGVAPQCRAN